MTGAALELERWLLLELAGWLELEPERLAALTAGAGSEADRLALLARLELELARLERLARLLPPAPALEAARAARARLADLLSGMAMAALARLARVRRALPALEDLAARGLLADLADPVRLRLDLAALSGLLLALRRELIHGNPDAGSGCCAGGAG